MADRKSDEGEDEYQHKEQMVTNRTSSFQPKSTEDSISKLAKMRAADRREEFMEERASFSAVKRGYQAGDDEEDDFTAEEEPPAKKPLTVAERLMAAMGHKAGEGLGKHGQGISEPIASSTQRGRTGLGHNAGKATARDFNEVWDETTEEKTVVERVEWMTDIEEEKRAEICEQLKDDKWMVIGKVDTTTFFTTEIC